MISATVVSPEDWRLWRTLRLAALADAPAAFVSTLAEWTGPGDTEQRWRTRLASIPLNLVLELDARPAGMVSGTAPNAAGAVELISLWVTPAARGRGVGDAAIECVIGWARTEHGTGVELSVKADNAAAIWLYERHGFVDAGPSPEYPGERLMRS